MTQLAWRPFLERFSREVLADRHQRSSLPPEVVASGWLGFPPATEEEIERLEQRLSTRLPDSYRAFLQTTNGWRTAGAFVYDLLPTSKVTWFRDSHQDWIDAWMEGEAAGGGSRPVSDEEYFVYGPEQNTCNFRHEYWRATLAISSEGDSAIYLLNPRVLTVEGEWEAWCFTNWYPGAQRHRTFWDLMQHECRSFVELRDQDEKRYFPEDGIESLPRKLSGLFEHLAAEAQIWRSLQEKRRSKGRLTKEPYDDGVIQALEAAESEVRRIATKELAPDTLLGRLISLAMEREKETQAGARSNECRHDEVAGRAFGNGKAGAIIRWFLNEPQSQAECSL